MADSNQAKRETVVLVHGLWMHSLVLIWFGWQLYRQGYQVRLFSYRSLLRTPVQNADILAGVLRKLDSPIVHLVGHSLGGIVLLHLLDRHADLKPGRMVLLGSPVRGSHVAANIRKLPLIRTLLLGRSIHQGVLGGCPKFPGNRELGVICGNRPIGFGRMFMSTEQSSDGTVLVRETHISRARESLELGVTHTSLMFSPEVVRQVVCFLGKGRFCS